MRPPTTSWGAVWAEPGRTAALLRARASVHGYPLTGAVPPVDLIAACVAADAWHLATGATLPYPEDGGGEAVTALDRIYQRAAGAGPAPHPGPCLAARHPPDSWFALAEAWSQWAGRWCGRAGDALRRAAQDLHGLGHPELDQVAFLLDVAADLHTTTP